MSLDDIAAEIKNCQKCPLHKTRNRTVPGEGNPEAKIVLIGEGPGRDEDAKGRPFVGRAGKLLDGMLQEAGLLRSQVFIANIVKCRPPENRKPRTLETEACADFLERQLDQIGAKVHVPMGNTALQALLGEDKIGKNRGKLFRNERDYIPTYHPAAILRNPNRRGDFVADMVKVKEYAGASGKAVSLKDFL